MITPAITKLPKLSQDYIKNLNEYIYYGDTPHSPLFILGFNYHIIFVRNKMLDRLRYQFEKRNKNKINIVNPFEIFIFKEQDTIYEASQNYFKINITTPNFFDIWEILFYIDIVPLKKRSVRSLYLTKDDASLKMKEKNNPIYFFRTKYGTSKDDTYHTFNDLKKVSEKYDVIISDSDYFELPSKEEEYKFYKENIKYINYAINHQEKDGTFIFKVYDMFTIITAKIITLLQLYYNDVFIVKPFSSNLMKHDKYIIAYNFKENHKSNIFQNLINDFQSQNNSNKFINDLLVDIALPHNHKQVITYMNTLLISIQADGINKYIEFIKQNNYFGDEFKKMRKTQEEGTKYWTSKFLTKTPVDKELTKAIDDKIKLTYMNTRLD